MARIVYLGLGLLFTAIGFVGAFVPLLPTVPLLLLALWCFARSSQRLHDWLYTHPKYGPPIRAWDAHGVVPRRAKIAACSMMALSMVVMLAVTDLTVWLYLVIAAILTAVGAWISTRPSAPPLEPATGKTFPDRDNPR
jgi:uncharacterized membrane protein YbaN (DUF454 family)